MDDIESGKTKLVSGADRKARSPTDDNEELPSELLNVTLVSRYWNRKALYPIDVTELGILTSVRTWW